MNFRSFLNSVIQALFAQISLKKKKKVKIRILNKVS